jgi:hypothetical protein
MSIFKKKLSGKQRLGKFLEPLAMKNIMGLT